MPQNASQPTQDFVEIKKIKDGIVYLKNGQLLQVIAVNGINFDLKSEEEQGAIIASFQKFLNSLDFKTQIFIHSRKVNIKSYIEKIEERKKAETNELLKIQIEEYINFIKSFVEENAIISKDFFIIVSYTSLPLNTGDNKLFSFFNFNKKQEKETVSSQSMAENVEQLRIRAESVIQGIHQMGLRAAPLEDEELIELFYNLYNPQLVEKKGLNL